MFPIQFQSSAGSTCVTRYSERNGSACAPTLPRTRQSCSMCSLILMPEGSTRKWRTTPTCRAWIEWNLRNYDEIGFGPVGMELKAGSQFIGDCGLTYQDVEGRRGLEIGYHVIERERGKGYATEAARVCLDFGFTRTLCESICSIVRPSNTASCAVAAHIHMVRREFTKGGRPALLFHTTRCDWEARRTNR
jgi:ribosomal-protein-alanine N-acetyltransferase